MPAWALTAALTVVYVVWDPPSADLAAQRFRAELFEREGFSVIDTFWYAGHHVPSYSLLFPPLAALLGPTLVGACSAVGASAAFERLVNDKLDGGGRAASLLFAAGALAPLLSGRLTFALGLALGLAAALAAGRERPGLAAGLALLTSAASPVAGAFLALAALAWLLVDRRPAAAALGLCSVLPAVVTGLLFPTGGTFPFVASSFWPALAAAVLIAAVIPAHRRVLRTGALLYVVALTGAAAIPSPMGGNAVRLGTALGAPVVLGALWPRRTAVVVVLPLLWWQWSAAIDDVVRAGDDPAVTAGYYTGLRARLEALPGPLRVEIPFTDQHWESYRVGRHFPLARGWERQLDRKVNRVLYDDDLDDARYRAWLRDTAVTHVALPDAALDYSAAREAALVRREPPYLLEIWRDRHWRLFAVLGATPLAGGPARATAVTPDSVALRFDGAGSSLVRVRHSPYWAADGACVAKDGPWTRVTTRRAGPITLQARFAVRRIGKRGVRCS